MVLSDRVGECSPSIVASPGAFGILFLELKVLDDVVEQVGLADRDTREAEVVYMGLATGLSDFLAGEGSRHTHDVDVKMVVRWLIVDEHAQLARPDAVFFLRRPIRLSSDLAEHGQV